MLTDYRRAIRTARVMEAAANLIGDEVVAPVGPPHEENGGDTMVCATVEGVSIKEATHNGETFAAVCVHTVRTVGAPNRMTPRTERSVCNVMGVRVLPTMEYFDDVYFNTANTH